MLSRKYVPIGYFYEPNGHFFNDSKYLILCILYMPIIYLMLSVVQCYINNVSLSEINNARDFSFAASTLNVGGSTLFLQKRVYVYIVGFIRRSARAFLLAPKACNRVKEFDELNFLLNSAF